MLRRTEGIVLRSIPYGEADLIVTFLTPDLGMVAAFAKGPRRIKSRFGSSLEPFTCSRVSFLGKEDSPMPRLTQADIVKSFQGLRENLRCFMMLSELAELTIGLMPEGKANAEVYALLKDALQLMEGECCQRNQLLYKIRLLKLKGYAPGLKGCGRCGREASDFYPSQGTMLCGRCARGMQGGGGGPLPIRLSPGGVRLHECLGGWELEKVKRIKATEAMLGELAAVLDAHIGYILSRPLRSKGAYMLYSNTP
jgi:DNA repair protein RecO (recombination protein O)